MIESLPFIDDKGTIRVHTKGGGAAAWEGSGSPPPVTRKAPRWTFWL